MDSTHVHFGHFLLKRLYDLLLSANNHFGLFNVFFPSNFAQRCPRSRNDRPRSASRHRRSGVEPSLPVHQCEELVVTQLSGPEQAGRVAFWAGPVLVSVDADRSEARHAEIKQEGHFESCLFCEGNEETHAAVKMAADVVVFGEGGDLGKIVKVAEGVFWAGGHETDRV